jgi:tetratricopeptide (TPR) repeat protein
MCVIPGSPEDLAAHVVIDTMGAAIRNGADSAEVYFRRGVAHKQTFHLPLAVLDFTDVIARADRSDVVLGRAHFFRSICHRRMLRFDDAIADGDAAVALRPTDSHTWTVRGFARANVGRLDEAERDLNEALRLDPTNWLAEVYRGFNRFSAGDHAAAIGAYDRAMALTDGWVSFGPFLNRGITHLVVGDLDRARNDIEHAAALRPTQRLTATDPRPNAYLALVRYLEGRFDDAHHEVHEAEHLGPDPMASLVHAMLDARVGNRTALTSLLAEMAAWHPKGVLAGTQAAARFLADPVSIIALINPLTR